MYNVAFLALSKIYFEITPFEITLNSWNILNIVFHHIKMYLCQQKYFSEKCYLVNSTYNKVQFKKKRFLLSD